MPPTGGPGAHRSSRGYLVPVLLVLLLLASLGAAPTLSARPPSVGHATPSAEHSVAPPAVARGSAPHPELSPLSVGDVVRSAFVNYNASLTGNFVSSVDDWFVGPGAYVPSTGKIWLSDLPARLAPAPLPRYAPAILFDPATNSFTGIVPQLANTSDLVYDAANGLLYSADPLNNTVGVFDPATNNWAGSPIPVGSEPISLTLDSANSTLFVANYGSSNLTVIKTTTARVLTSVATGSSPFALALDPTNQTLFVACAASPRLTAINTTTYAPASLPPLNLGGNPGGVAYSTSTSSVAASVPGPSRVSIFNLTNGVTTTIHIGPGLGPVSAIPSNSDFVVANSAGSNLVEVDPNTGIVTNSSIAVGAAPTSFDLNPSDGTLFVWSSVSRTLSQVWGAGSLTSVGSPSLGPTPSAIAFDPGSGRVLVADSNDSTVSFLVATGLTTAAPPLQLTSRPLSLASDAATGMVYAGLASGLVAINPSTASVVASSTALSGATEALLVDSPDSLLWALNSVHGLVAYALPALSTSFMPGIGAGQTGIHTLALDPTTDQLFVPVNTSGTAAIAVVTASDGSVVNGNAASAPGLVSLAYDAADGDVYGLGTNLSILNGSTLSLVGPPLTIAPHTVAGVVVYDPSREYVYATTLNGPDSTGILTVVDGSSALASYAGEVNMAVGEGPVAATPVEPSNDATPGTSEIWIANSVAGTVGIVASSPPRITGFAAVPYQFDLGESTHLVVNYEGGAGPSSLSFASLPGGCTSSNTADLNCTPAATGTYTVTVQVTDALGDFGSATTALTVEPGLAVSATFVPLTFPATDVGWAVGMIASATGGVGPYQYLWSFGDGNSTPGVHVEHGYLTPGEYVLTLLVTDSLGGMGSASWAIQVNPQIAVQVDAPLFATDVGRPLALSATVTGGTEANRSVLWSFGDQTTQTSSQATHVWTAAGVYNVTARAVDGVGASATRSVLVTVNAAPAARFTVTGGSVSAPPRPGTEFFYNTTLFAGTGPFGVQWLFGDGSEAFGTNVTHTYSAAGNYTVTAIVTDAAGDTVNGTLSVAVLPPLPSSSGSSSLTFTVGVFLGAVLGAAAASLLVFAASGKRRKPPAPPPPSPYVPPSRAVWKED